MLVDNSLDSLFSSEDDSSSSSSSEDFTASAAKEVSCLKAAQKPALMCANRILRLLTGSLRCSLQQTMKTVCGLTSDPGSARRVAVNEVLSLPTQRAGQTGAVATAHRYTRPLPKLQRPPPYLPRPLTACKQHTSPQSFPAEGLYQNYWTGEGG